MAGNPRVIRCANCGSGVDIRAQGRSVTATCKSCKSIIDTADPSFAILSSFKQAKTYEPTIPLGKRGTLRGDKWECIGYVRRADTASVFEWDEYLLFNPLKGFKWLMCANGHWTLIVVTKQKPTWSKSSKSRASYLNHTYALYFEGKAKVVYVEGEFYWRVSVGETVAVKDFVRPPEVLSSEEADGEIVWSIGDYIQKNEIEAAFGPKLDLPAQTGVAPNQPSPVGSQSTKTLGYACVLTMLLVVLSVVQAAMARGDQVIQKSLTYQAAVATADPVLVTEPFELAGGTANVEVELAAADLANSWLEAEMTLTNVDTGNAVGLQSGLEFYFGTEDGYAWSEGSRASTELLSAVPPGKYTLTVEPSGPTPLRPLPYLVTVRRDVADFSNLVWGILLLWGFPIVVGLRHWAHEVSRWSDSDHSPYKDS